MARWIAKNAPRRIDEKEWHEIAEALAPVSPGYLRRLLRASGVELSPVVEGVRQEDLDALARSLIALSEEYERGDRQRRNAVRGVVIEGKDHARLVAGRDGPESPKHEMILWMLTWLENPPLFPHWVRLRRHAQT